MHILRKSALLVGVFVAGFSLSAFALERGIAVNLYNNGVFVGVVYFVSGDPLTDSNGKVMLFRDVELLEQVAEEEPSRFGQVLRRFSPVRLFRGASSYCIFAEQEQEQNQPTVLFVGCSQPLHADSKVRTQVFSGLVQVQSHDSPAE